MLSYRLGTVNVYQLNQFETIANLTLSQHLLEKKKRKNAFTFSNIILYNKNM